MGGRKGFSEEVTFKLKGEWARGRVRVGVQGNSKSALGVVFSMTNIQKIPKNGAVESEGKQSLHFVT